MMQKAGLNICRPALRRNIPQWQSRKPLILRHAFHGSRSSAAVKPFVLADIGEGIKEVQIIQWFVQPGARVEQFDKICEVQSDKASVEITSRFDGVINKLHHEPDDMAQVGKPLCDIDIQGDIDPKDEKLLIPDLEQAGEPEDPQQPQKATQKALQEEPTSEHSKPLRSSIRPSFNGKEYKSLATPAVRGLLKELGINIEDVDGTGKDGRVMKEDIHKFVASRENGKFAQAANPAKLRPVANDGLQRETKIPLTLVQSAMFKTMTRSLTIPHFLYSDEVDVSSVSSLRKTLNELKGAPIKLSMLSFTIKAVSMALLEYPILNARVETQENGGAPQLIMREKHNIGVAMDTSQGLLVPNIKDVASLSVYEIAEQLSYLQAQAKASKLKSSELTGGTITVSNIGSIGGTYAAPVIVQSEVAILATGKTRVVPAFDDDGAITKKSVGNFSWSADHRVIDGATMARMAERVRQLIEQPGLMAAGLR